MNKIISGPKINATVNSTASTAIFATGFSIAFFHAAIPTHWLPFVLTARAQKWNHSKALCVTALAGCGHVLFTALLGFLVAWGGMKLSDKVGAWFPRIAGGALVLFGFYYLVQQLRGKRHGHAHASGGHARGGDAQADAECGPRGGMLVNTGHGFVELTVFEAGAPPVFRLFCYDARRQSLPVPADGTVKLETSRTDGTRQTFAFRAAGECFESTTAIPEPHEFRAIVELAHGGHAHTLDLQFAEHDHDHGGHRCSPAEAVPAPPRKSDWAAITSLLALLTFSPCEGFIPVYVSGAKYGWSGFFLLTVILSFATVGGMVFFTSLTLFGVEKLKLGWLERYERGILGGLLVLLGVVIILFEH